MTAMCLFCGTTRKFQSFFPNDNDLIIYLHGVAFYVVGQADVAERDGRPGGSPGVPV